MRRKAAVVPGLFLLLGSNALADTRSGRPHHAPPDTPAWGGHVAPWAPPTKLANAGDSISQGFAADGWLGDRPSLSWVQGTDARVDSVFMRYAASNTDMLLEPESVTGAELVGGDDDFAAQASRICAQAVPPTRVTVLLGANDVCNRPASSSGDAAANLYSVTTWTHALRAGLDQLAACLPPRSVVHVLSTPRVDFLYEAGHAKNPLCASVTWQVGRVCPIVTVERSAARRAQVGARIDAYNAALAGEVRAYAANENDKNPRGVGFVTDWAGSIAEGHAGTSIGTVRFGPDDIDPSDCFHPSISGQRGIACLAWARGPDGTGSTASCGVR